MSQYTYNVAVVFMEEYGKVHRTVFPNPYENLQVILTPSQTMEQVAVAIGDALFEISQEELDYYIFAVSIDDYMINVDDDGGIQNKSKPLGHYILEGEEHEVDIVAFGVPGEDGRAAATGPLVLFPDVSRHTAFQNVHISKAEGVLRNMKTGMGVITECIADSCITNGQQQSLYQVPMNHTTGTCDFDPIIERLSCGACNSILDYKGIVFFNCEYKYKGKQLSKRPVRVDYKSTMANNLRYIVEDGEYQQFSNLVNWERLLIQVKIMASQRCSYCSQLFKEESAEGDVKATAGCGHQYHQSCLTALRQGQYKCRVKGCSAVI